MKSRSEIKRVLVQNPGRVIEEIERLKKALDFYRSHYFHCLCHHFKDHPDIEAIKAEMIRLDKENLSTIKI